MKRFLLCLLVIMAIFSGCAVNEPEPTWNIDRDYAPVTPVGTVPKEFETIVSENVFSDAIIQNGRALKYRRESAGYTVSMYGLWGDHLASHSRTVDTGTYHICGMRATADGGFLFVLGFGDHAYEDGTWASNSGICSTIVKCDTQGQVQWETPVENYEGWALRLCIETEDAYFFFGDRETPETKVTGIGSPTDAHIMKLSKTGQILLTKAIGGSDYDSVKLVEEENGYFTLYCHAQSSDGDFSKPGDWKVEVDNELKLRASRKVDDIPGEPIGMADEVPVYPQQGILENFADGIPSAVIDYGDFYLVVSENITGIYEHTPPFISSLWYYTETAYGAYDSSGNVLWKAAVDSSPDYDSMVSEISGSS